MRLDNCVRVLQKIHGRYTILKKSRLKKAVQNKMFQDLFISDISELFDIAPKDVMFKTKYPDDVEFLQKQREDVLSCSMSTVDMDHEARIKRKRKRSDDEMIVRKRYDERETKTAQRASARAAVLSADKDILQDQDAEDTSFFISEMLRCDEFEPTVYVRKVSVKPNVTVVKDEPNCTTDSSVLKNIFLNKDVSSALDRAQLTDRSAMFVVSSVVKALGHDLDTTTMSFPSIRRARMATREEISLDIKKQLSEDSAEKEPLVLHWDGKMLPELCNKYSNCDRTAILVTGNGKETLLGVPMIESGTGESIAKLCIHSVKEACVDQQIKALSFDTTPSNTGLNKGACVNIEKELGGKIWLACRHHMHELVLTKSFNSTMGPTVGPDVLLFKRFRNKWADINKTEYCVPENEIFENVQGQRIVMMRYLEERVREHQCRDDYKEILELCFLFLGRKIPDIFYMYVLTI